MNPNGRPPDHRLRARIRKLKRGSGLYAETTAEARRIFDCATRIGIKLSRRQWNSKGYMLWRLE